MVRLAAVALTLFAAPLSAADFAAGSNAKSWGLLGEEKALFTARVVDILCEMTGDCPADCGGGDRQLGLVRASDGVLVFPMKNSQPLFNGAVADLRPWCGEEVEVDGLLVGDEERAPAKFYMVQFIRAAGEAEWIKADRWTKVWAGKNPEAAKKDGPWFRKDPRVEAEIAKGGYLGLGAEADKAFIEDWF
ncbi:hypothetical protein G5B40_16730 [Pikeienuella piscinae]|uniref:Uncharacterized protein n=1 Tax=Pikeienuella piscinae TaxID=2748098 RepID=A0A7M3T7G0_9RHOB|nr:hypothetical protein G5B40_16730 [Pikeienuella piscinae]